MFAVLVSGRLPQRNYQTVSPTQIVFQVDNATQINNLAVFMTGDQALPNDMGAVIFLRWPPAEHWIYLGYLSNSNPSQVFKVSQTKEPTNLDHNAPNFGNFANAPQNIASLVGIEVRNLKEIEHQFGTKTQKKERQVGDMLLFSKKMLDSLYHYCESFAVDIPNNATGRMEKIVPLAILSKWYSTFESKLKNNIDFWRKGGD